jgi:hypothetical protein
MLCRAKDKRPEKSYLFLKMARNRSFSGPGLAGASDVV